MTRDGFPDNEKKFTVWSDDISGRVISRTLQRSALLGGAPRRPFKELLANKWELFPGLWAPLWVEIPCERLSHTLLMLQSQPRAWALVRIQDDGLLSQRNKWDLISANRRPGWVFSCVSMCLLIFFENGAVGRPVTRFGPRARLSIHQQRGIGQLYLWNFC